jgi:hypothetical protein
MYYICSMEGGSSLSNIHGGKRLFYYTVCCTFCCIRQTIFFTDGNAPGAARHGIYIKYIYKNSTRRFARVMDIPKHTQQRFIFHKFFSSFYQSKYFHISLLLPAVVAAAYCQEEWKKELHLEKVYYINWRLALVLFQTLAEREKFQL